MSRVETDIAARLSAGWTWIGPLLEDGAWTLRAGELPDFFVAAESPQALLAELPNAMRAYFRSYVDQDLPLPAVPNRWQALVGEFVFMNSMEPKLEPTEPTFSAVSEPPKVQMAS